MFAFDSCAGRSWLLQVAARLLELLYPRQDSQPNPSAMVGAPLVRGYCAQRVKRTAGSHRGVQYPRTKGVLRTELPEAGRCERLLRRSALPFPILMDIDEA